MVESFKGRLALDDNGGIGLITDAFPRYMLNKDGSKLLAYVGIKLTKVGMGDRWVCKSPKVLGAIVGNVDEIIQKIEVSK